jgi:hypothetical protein
MPKLTQIGFVPTTSFAPGPDYTFPNRTLQIGLALRQHHPRQYHTSVYLVPHGATARLPHQLLLHLPRKDGTFLHGGTTTV